MSLLLLFQGCAKPKVPWGLGKPGPSNIYKEKKDYKRDIQKDDDEIVFILANIIPGVLN